MSQINFEYFLDDVVPSVIGAEIPLILLHIRNAAIRFCEKSWAWQLDGLPIDVIGSEPTYPLVTPSDQAEIVKIMSVKLNGKTLDVSSLPAIEAVYHDSSYRKGSPHSYWQDYVEQLNLFPMPDFSKVAGLTYRMALRPSRTAEGMDGSVAKRYFDAISDGAKASLFEIPNKPWSDGQASSFHSQRFNVMATHAQTEVMRGLGRGPIRVVGHT